MTLQDDRRDLLIGATPVKSPESQIGELYVRLPRGEISRQEFDLAVKRGLLAEAVRPAKRSEDPSYG